MKYIHGTLKDYLDDLAARIPAPGGGSAAALSASMSASLLAMACYFTLGKKKYRKAQPQIKSILKKTLETKKRLAELVDEDVRAYRGKDTDAAIRVPAEICVLSSQLIEFCVVVAQKSNKYLVSDVLMAAFLAEASYLGGLLYVHINIAALKKDSEKYAKLAHKVRALRKKIDKRIGVMKKKAEVYLGHFARR